jgi:cytochrome c peroxidase
MQGRNTRERKEIKGDCFMLHCTPPALRRGLVRLALSLLALFVCGLTGSATFSRQSSAILSVPRGLPAAVPIPDTNPLTAEKIALGRRLFFDQRLSPNDTMSCAVCHVPAQGFTVHESRLAVGFKGKTTKRNSPTLYNVAYQQLLFHDGREFTLEDQSIAPLTSAAEMGNPSIGYVVDKIKRLPGYDAHFRQAFGEGVSVATLGEALASYERTLLSANSPFDRWYFAGEAEAVTDEVKTGFALFTGKGRCVECHVIGKEAALFTDQAFHHTGVAQLPLIAEQTEVVDESGRLLVQIPRAHIERILPPAEPDFGRAEVTFNLTNRWEYKTPSLRNVALTAPYMHNGVLSTLDEVIDYYDRGGTGAAGQDARIAPKHFTTDEKHALRAFLRSLTGDNVSRLAQEADSNSE